MEETVSSTKGQTFQLSQSLSSRFEGYIEIPFTSRLRSSLLRLFSYLDNYSPKMTFLYAIITIMRFLQIIGPALMVSNKDIWDQDAVTTQVLDLVSICWHLVPVRARAGNEPIILYCFVAIQLFFVGFLSFTAYKYKTTIRVPKVSNIIVSLYTACCAFTLPVITTQFMGELIASLFNGNTEVGPVPIIAVVLSFITVALYVFVLQDCYNFTLTFRATSLITIEGSPQNYLIGCTLAFTLLLSLTNDTNKYGQVVLMVLAFVPYTLLLLQLFNAASFIHASHQIMILSGCITSYIFIIGNIIALFWRPWTEIEVVIYIIIFLAITLLSSFIVQRLRARNLAILDSFDESHDIDVIGSPKKLKTLLATGFTFAHPCCVNYTIFSAASAAWPDSLSIWSNFAKFAAIYPEKTQTLVVISQSIAANKFKGKVAETVHSCIADIVKTRETNLIPDLKSKLTKISRLTSKTKNKLRNIWDLVLQGNIGEIESAVHSAFDTMHVLDLEIEHLISLYPNNRFASRVYARYFLEIKADQENYKKWKENTQMLQRGVQVHPDAVQGLAFDVFPNLPLALHDIVNGPLSVGFSEVMTDEFLSEDEKMESTDSLSQLITNHKIKSVQFIYITSIIQFAVFLLIPIIFFLIYFEFYNQELEAPLNVIYGLAFLRNNLNMITAFVADYLMVKIDDPINVGNKIMNEMSFTARDQMTAFGGNKDVDTMLEYVIQQVMSLNSLINTLRNYKEGDYYIDQAREAMFQTEIKYNYYQGKGDNQQVTTNPEAVLPRVCSQASKLLDLTAKNTELLFSSEALTSLNNNDEASTAMNRALSRITDYIQHQDEVYQSTYTYVMIALILLTIIVAVIIYVSQVLILTRHKLEVFKLLSTLPKTVISNISASFYSLKKKDTMTSSQTDISGDINKQEENIIKVFSSISDSTRSSATIIALFLQIFYTLFACLAFFTVLDSYKNVSTTLLESAPHVDYLLGSSSYLFSIMSKLFKIAVDRYDASFNGLIIDLENEITLCDTDFTRQMRYFNNLRFGANEDNSYPFSGMDGALAHADTVVVCEDPLTPPTTFRDGAYCFDSEGQIYLVTSYVQKFLGQMTVEDPPHYLKPKGENLAQCWQVGVVMTYESFFYPVSQDIIQTIKDEIGSERVPLFSFACVFLVLCLVLVIVTMISAHKEGEYLRFTLRLLLHAPVKVIMGSPRILSLLNGNYGHSNDDTTQRDADFYEDIVSKLNDVVIVSNLESEEITNVNNAFTKVFKTDKKDIINTNIRNFFASSKFVDINIEDLLSKQCEIVYDDGGEKTYFNTSVITVNGNRIIIARNNTMRVMHQLLIDEEKKKSDAMLSSILPPSLVPRVQAGEKNISFAVQSVSVAFMDIVSFTPWCGSHDAAYIMKTLNYIFKEDDALVAQHKTLSKIKCIGDCYMCAGGIFDEVNNPAQHAKEMVEFGLDAIRKLIEIDEVLNEQLRIRVGINTGGPIVAGVFTTGKPTFEILGPTINMAQQMEHHGVPMQVHVSRPVYELIYGGNFDIKERGEIEVKNGKTFTYLVDPHVKMPTPKNPEQN